MNVAAEDWADESPEETHEYEFDEWHEWHEDDAYAHDSWEDEQVAIGSRQEIGSRLKIVFLPAYCTFFLGWLKAGAGKSISMGPIIGENDEEFNNRLRTEQVEAIHLNDTSSYITRCKQRPSKNMQIYTLDQILMTYKVLKIIKNDGIYKTSIMPSFLTGGNITTMQIFPVSDAAATCSDLPYPVTEYVDAVTVNTAEFLEDSGDEEVFKLLKTGMMGWQKAQSKKQERKKTTKHALRPFQQQQHAATAQMLSEDESNEDYGSYTLEQERENPDDGKNEKRIYVKTWAGRTITAVIDSENNAKILKILAAAEQAFRQKANNS